MSVDRVKKYFSKFGIENRILEFDESSATVKEASEALGCKEGEIAKSLSFELGDKSILVVVAGDMRIDNSKYKNTFGVKAKMLDVSLVLDRIGHPVGGVCPFDVNDGVDVYLDVSLKEYDIVYPACGSSNSAIGVSIEELEKLSNYVSWVDICK